MSFKWIVNGNRVTLEFETDTIDQARDVLASNSEALDEVLSFGPNDDDGQGDSTTEAPAATGTTKRKRRTKAEIAADKAAEEAKAAAPAPTVTAPPPVPVPTTVTAGTDAVREGIAIPAFLDRNKVAPPPAAVPPAPPPSGGALVGKIVDDLNARKKASADDGKALVGWLAQTGIVAATATYDEAVAVLQFTALDKLKPIADALGVAA